jgi:phosphatidylethanolamine-binding protein (PEBP) family uncharacterized protein
MHESDPDNLSRAKPSVAEWLHWLVTNIPASNINEGIMGGQTVMAYGERVEIFQIKVILSPTFRQSCTAAAHG